MLRSLLICPFVSCLAWPLASGFLYLFSGETGSFPEYWGLTFLLLTPLFLATIADIVIHKNQTLQLKIVKFFEGRNLFLSFLYLWIFYIFVFIISFVIQLPCFFFICDFSVLNALQFLIFTIAVHFFYIDFLLFICFYKKFITGRFEELCKQISRISIVGTKGEE